MNVIFGLGNPGNEYRDTRHNIGYMVVDKLAREIGVGRVVFETNRKLGAEIVKVGNVLLVKPTTFMNRSGVAVKAVADFYKISPESIWVIHDDIDLPLGKIKIRNKGASGGHNGIESIITNLKTDGFVRFRLGIGRGKDSSGMNPDRNLRHRAVINFVLSRFRQGEAGEMKKLVKYGTEAVRIALNDGLDKAMNRFN